MLLAVAGSAAGEHDIAPLQSLQHGTAQCIAVQDSLGTGKQGTTQQHAASRASSMVLMCSHVIVETQTAYPLPSSGQQAKVRASICIDSMV